MLLAKLTTAPTFDPIEISEAQEHLIINGEETYITELLLTARGMVERYLNRSLTLQTWTAYASQWCREFILPYGPLLTVTSVKYYDGEGVHRTLSASTYWVDTVKEPGRVVLAYDFNPPELQDGRPNAIEIVYTAGYTSSTDRATQQHAIPDSIRHGIKVLLTDLHEHRGQYVIGSAGKLPDFVMNLLHPYRLY